MPPDTAVFPRGPYVINPQLHCVEKSAILPLRRSFISTAVFLMDSTTVSPCSSASSRIAKYSMAETSSWYFLKLVTIIMVWRKQPELLRRLREQSPILDAYKFRSFVRTYDPS